MTHQGHRGTVCGQINKAIEKAEAGRQLESIAAVFRGLIDGKEHQFERCVKFLNTNLTDYLGYEKTNDNLLCQRIINATLALVLELSMHYEDEFDK